MSAFSTEMLAVLERRLAELRQQPFHALLTLLEYSEESVSIEGREVTLMLWKMCPNEREVQIVVQIYRHHILGIGTMTADGFIKNTSEEILPLPEKVRLEYC